MLIGVNKGTCLFPDLDYHEDKMNIHVSIYYYTEFIHDILNRF
jgi:hypothetical protein